MGYPHFPNARHGIELPASLSDWPIEWREEYEERAGIVEEGSRGLTRSEAEREAERIVRHQARKGQR